MIAGITFIVCLIFCLLSDKRYALGVTAGVVLMNAIETNNSIVAITVVLLAFLIVPKLINVVGF